MEMNLKEMLKNRSVIRLDPFPEDINDIDPRIDEELSTLIMSPDAPTNGAYDFEEEEEAKEVIPQHIEKPILKARARARARKPGIPSSFVKREKDPTSRKYVKQTPEQKIAYDTVTKGKKIFVELAGHQFEVKKFLIQAWIRENPSNTNGMEIKQSLENKEVIIITENRE